MTTGAPLMPKATAVWLVDNTSLTFEQIAQFCQLHVLEVKGIADGDVAHGIKGMDPITSGQLTRDEIERAQENTGYRLKLAAAKVEIPEVKTKRGPRYTPVSRRQDRPNAILWLLRYHPELKDSQVMRLVGTTKPTIQSIKDRTHWNSPNLQPADPVTLGLCSQTDLDTEVQKAAKRVERERKAQEAEMRKAGTLLPSEETTEPQVVEEETLEDLRPDPNATISADDVFADSEPMSAPEEEEAIPTAEDVFSSSPTPTEDAPAGDEEEDADPDSVFAKLQELKKGME